MSEEDPSSSGAGRRPGDVLAPARCSFLRVDPRGYPIIAVIPQSPGKEDYGTLSEARKLVLATYDLCAVCALPFRDELRWQVGFDDQLQRMETTSGVFEEEVADLETTPRFSEAPVHEVCALYAAQVCPYVSSPHARLGDEVRKGRRRPKTLILAGFDRTAGVYGHASEMQSGAGILMFEMAGLRRTHRLTSEREANEAYTAALRDEVPIVLDDAERRLVEILSTPTPEDEDSGTLMAGGAWIVGAAFCPQVRQVDALARRFAKSDDSPWMKMAATFAARPEDMADMTTFTDTSIAAATTWFATRETVPALLQQWRADGRRQVRMVGAPAPRGSGGTAQGIPDETAIRRRQEGEKARRRDTEKARRKQARRRKR
ncbi:hypothetical protein [Actinoplanes sp. NPDC089786]|uniref:hypothetical protein n=1 Tax=Actinoplanes sp. NPDC089786 TaxID=3155185 RepID=UPI003443329D